MTQMNADFSIKLAETADEIAAAQRLRYRVFVEEMGAAQDASSQVFGLEADGYDAYFDHLILQDNNLPQNDNVVGVYRLLRSEVANAGLGFYSAGEFKLDKIINCGRNAVELGRSCVDTRYRGGTAMYFLLNGLAEYVEKNQIEILFGAASFHGTDIQKVAYGLSYLHHNHLAENGLQVAAYGLNAIAMDIYGDTEIDRVAALLQIPPLIKSYLRLGGTVGTGAYVDYAFNTIDVCLVMDTARMVQKYKNFYLRDNAA